VGEEPTDEQLLEQVEDELRRLKVSDLLVQSVYTVSSLGYRRLTRDDLDLEQARLAIDALGALIPVLEGSVPGELVRDLNQVKANMQLAYAKAVSEAGAESPQPESPDAEGQEKVDEDEGEESAGESA
jgi:hypothetical protein